MNILSLLRSNFWRADMVRHLLGPNIPLITSALFALGAPLMAATNDLTGQTYVIELVDSTGVRSYQAVPLDQYHRLRAEAGIRNRFLPKALLQTREEWKSIHKGVSKAFPSDVAEPESVTSLGLFTSPEAARTRVMELRAKDEQKREADGDKLTSIEKQIKAIRESIQRLNASVGTSVQDKEAKIQAERLALRILERDAAEQAEKRSKKEEDLNVARSIFERKLSALLSASIK